MKVGRINHGGRAHYCEPLDEEHLRLWSGAPWLSGTPTNEQVLLSKVRLLAPVEPSKIVCVGRNYRRHAAELGNEVPQEPLLFLKPPSSLLSHGAQIVLPEASREVHHEGEIALVIGQPLRSATEAECGAAIYGITCANDVTARDLQSLDRTFARAKSFDTFCPLGPWIDTTHQLDDAEIVLRVNGARRQTGHVREMCWSPVALLQYISTIMTLVPGDVVLTGTPEGVGPIASGDRVEVEIPGVGVLSNPVGGELDASLSKGPEDD